ncbi:MAG: hypothetical protein ACFE0O_03495 [Opitutales bacterium]
MNAETYRKRWLLLSVLGLVLIGLGICIIGEAILLKGTGASALSWVLWGTGGLVVFNAGVACFGDAVKNRVHFERSRTWNKT